MYTVLAISCHPDDMEISCAGTLLRCKQRGDRVIVCHVANGNMGHVEIMPDKLGPLRIEEAKKACNIAGFEAITCDVGDLYIDETNEQQCEQLIKVIRECDPDFIITHGPDDYMKDHVAVSKLVFEASFSASVPHYKPSLGKASRVIPIYYMDNTSLLNCEPTEFVDISEHIETKLEMLACHKSQIEWLMDHDNSDILDNTRAFARVRGAQCDVRYAEGFRHLNVAYRNTVKRLLP